MAATGRGRKITVVLVILVFVLGGLFLAADRIAAYAAERTIAKQAKQELAAQNISSPEDPKVSVSGFPFLTQVAGGRYDKISISVTRPTAQNITLDDLLVVATGVNASTGALLNGTGQVTADNVTGTGRLGWDSVAKLIDLTQYGGANGAKVSALPDGRVQVRAPITVVGISTTAVATGTVEVAGTAIRLKISKVTFEGGSVPPALERAVGPLTQQLAFAVPLPPLPYHLKLTNVRAEPAGVTVTATAANVPIAGAGA
jgi:hypothetical protein